VSAADDGGFCPGETLADGKSGGITAVPELLASPDVKGRIATADATGCQRDIARLVMRKQARYMPGLKGNQGTLREDVKPYSDGSEPPAGCAYHKAADKARSHSTVEIRGYPQTPGIAWVQQRKARAGLASVVMTKNTVVKNTGAAAEARYFTGSLPLNVEEAARAIRSHRIVESCHWHPDVAFRGDANRTLDKAAAYNLDTAIYINRRNLPII
jgi:predicted transposase YbfD/YdcC